MSNRPKLDYGQIKLVRKALLTLSIRKVAILFGVSRGLINEVKQGRYLTYKKKKSEKTTKLFDRGSVPVRCSGCGGKVYTPCLVCETRSRMRKARHHARL